MADMSDEDFEFKAKEAKARARAMEMQAKPEAAPAPMPVAPEPPSALDPTQAKTQAGTALRSFGQGASFGFGDELRGLAGAQQELAARGTLGGLAATSLGMLGGAPGAIVTAANAPQLATGTSQQLASFSKDPLIDALLKRYRSDRDTARREVAVGSKENPKTAIAAELAGGLMAPGPKIARVGGVPLTKTGSLVASGAAAGGLYGAGSSNKEMPQDIAADALGSAAGGAIAGPIAAKGGELAARGLGKVATSSGLKALGVKAGISDSLKRRGYQSVAEGEQLARDAEGMGLIRPFRNAEDVARQAAERQEFVAGPQIEDVMTRADASGVPFDFDEAAWKSAENLMTRGRPVPAPLNPQEQKIGSEAIDMVGRVANTTAGDLGQFSEANRLKRALQASINYGADAPLSTEMQRGVASGVRGSIEEQVGRALSPEDATQLATANTQWGKLEDVRSIAEEEARRQAQRKFPLMQTLMAGALGSTAGAKGALGGAALGAIGSSVAPRVPSTVNYFARGASNRLQQLSPNIGQATAGALRNSALKPEEAEAVEAFLDSSP